MVRSDATLMALRQQTGDERKLWLLSALLAVVLTLLILGFFGLGSTIEWTFVVKPRQEKQLEPATDVLVVMEPALATEPAARQQAPVMAETQEKTPPVPQASPTPAAPSAEQLRTPEPSADVLLKKRFARTSAEQEVAHAVTSPVFGERNTEAVSDSAPVPGAPLLPSQAGVAPRSADDVETVNNRYQDGKLDVPPASPAVAPERMVTQVPAPASTPEPSPAAESQAQPNQALPEPLARIPAMAGDTAVPRALAPGIDDRPRAKPESEPASASAAPPKLDGTDKAMPKSRPDVAKPQLMTSDDPAFNGNQKKTRILGSVSRSGTSSQQVAASPLGKYQAQLSRVIESEWHRNCVKYRDFIKPGILTLRFVIDDRGAVRSVMLVEMVEAGDVQKGFTMNTIRQAKIPPLPADVQKELNGEPLELIYNFYF